jgi:PPK2 family polyphosphate:nucleotide phosphotransferase
MARKFSERFLVKPGHKAKVHAIDPDSTAGFTKPVAERLLKESTEKLIRLQYLLYAENKHALLIIIQAMDAGGKDGTIRRVFAGVDPHGINVTSFKAPTFEELEHDFLWRIHKAVPMRGKIGVFNRSQYEDILVARVRTLVSKAVWSRRYKQINRFEQSLAESGVVILKFFLHISKDEQKERLEARLHDPKKNWKVNPADFEERKYWDDYMEAYEDAINRCNAEWAPWFIIPANKKWFRNLIVSEIITETLDGLKMKFPPPMYDLSKIKIDE